MSIRAQPMTTAPICACEGCENHVSLKATRHGGESSKWRLYCCRACQRRQWDIRNADRRRAYRRDRYQSNSDLRQKLCERRRTYLAELDEVEWAHQLAGKRASKRRLADQRDVQLLAEMSR